MMSFDDILPSKKIFGGDPPKHQQQKYQRQNQQPKNTWKKENLPFSPDKAADKCPYYNMPSG